MKLIEDLITAADRQAVMARRIFIGTLTDGRTQRFRMTVFSDAHATQCFARAEMWNDTEGRWFDVYDIPAADMKTSTGLIYRHQPNHGGKPLSATDFDCDMNRLYTITGEIVGGWAAFAISSK